MTDLTMWRKTKLRRRFIYLNLVALIGCAAHRSVTLRPSPIDTLLQEDVGTALLSGRPERARKPLEAALRAQPRNGYLHILYGLSYQLADDSPQGVGLAKVGYDMAAKFAPDYFWAHYLLGSVALDRRQFHEAARQFSKAILEEPDRSSAYIGLAVAAYYAGDLPVTRIAADRAYALAPDDPLALRTAAYVAAAQGDQTRLDAILAQVEAVPDTVRDLKIHEQRLNQLLRTAEVEQMQPEAGGQAPDQGTVPPNQETMPPTDAGVAKAKQVMVEVTLLLSQNRTTRRTGINLLDGLMLQFGLEYLTERSALSAAANTFSESLTTVLRVPEISYSLNLFNTEDDYYAVLARPSLVATLGQESVFFIGRQIIVGVSGINLGAVETIDVGTSIKVTPLEISGERAKFRIDADRSFLLDQATGTFAEALATFKQTVGATIEVDFGRTLLLSGLYEAVDFGELSKVPGPGDVPGLDILFNARSRTQRRDAAIVLVTPYLPGSIETGPGEPRWTPKTGHRGTPEKRP